MAKWFNSEERSLLERLIRSRMAEWIAIISNAYCKDPTTIAFTVEQKEALDNMRSYQITLNVIAQLDKESSKAAENHEPVFVFTDKIAVT